MLAVQLIVRQDWNFLQSSGHLMDARQERQSIRMSYIRAEDILPKELIDTIQQYVSGKSIKMAFR